MGNFNTAAVCRRGHVQTCDVEIDGTDKWCPICGAEVLTSCPACGWRIPSSHFDDDGFECSEWGPPNFCTGCRSVMPWATDVVIIYELENRLENHSGLSDGDARMLRRRLELARKSLGSSDEDSRMTEALKFARDKAPAAFNAALPVIQAIATTVVRNQLGLPSSG
jgi:hypothetical protein